MGPVRALTLALLVAPALAFAQAPTAAQKKQAGELVKQAIAKSQAGEHEAAVQLYLDAYKIIPQPLLLSNVGSEYQQLEKPVEALKYFCKYLEEDPNGSNVTYAHAQAKTLYVELGGVTDVKDEDVCKPIVKPTPATPVTPTDPGTGTTGTVETGTRPPPDPTDQTTTKSNPLRFVGIGLAVVGAGAFGFGVYNGLEAKSISDEITNHPMNEPWGSDIKQREADGESAEKKQIIFMAAGGVALAAGVAMFFMFPPKQVTEEQVSFTPVATPDSLGFAAAGRF